MISVDFWEPQGPQMGHLGVPLGSNLVQIRPPFPVSAKMRVPGVQEGHFGVYLGRVLGVFLMMFDDFLVHVGSNWGSSP